jgi:hypothetical protein
MCDATRQQRLTETHRRFSISGEGDALEQPRPAKRHHRTGQVFQHGTGLGAQVHQLDTEALARREDVGGGLRRDVRGGPARAVDVDAVAVALNQAVARLQHEDERHVRAPGVKVDRSIDVRRRTLVLPLHAGHAAARGQAQVEQTDFARGADPWRAAYGTIESEHLLGQVGGRVPRWVLPRHGPPGHVEPLVGEDSRWSMTWQIRSVTSSSPSRVKQFVNTEGL